MSQSEGSLAAPVTRHDAVALVGVVLSVLMPPVGLVVSAIAWRCGGGLLAKVGVAVAVALVLLLVGMRHRRSTSWPSRRRDYLPTAC